MNNRVEVSVNDGCLTGRKVIYKGTSWAYYDFDLYNFFSLNMGHRDPRYDLIKPMLSEGKIFSFNDIFKFIPKTVVARDLGKKVDRFTALMNRVEAFTLAELFIIANYCGLNEAQILKLAENEYIMHKPRNF